MPGLSGRRPTPTALKVIRGNPGKRPLPENEPKPPEVDPAKPEIVAEDKVASAEWDRLLALTTMKGARVLTVADGPMLEAASMAYSEYRAANAAVKEHGLTYETTTPTGAIMHRPRPEVTQRSDAWKRYVAALTHFGLSPATRAKVKTADIDGDALDQLLERGRRGEP